jgi:peptidyl-prolyl cis-trans isomerase C
MRCNIVFVAALGALLALPGPAGIAGAAGVQEREAVASVNGVLVPRTFLVREVRRFEEQARGDGQVLDEGRQAELVRQALRTLVDMELLYQESRRRGFQVAPESIEAQIGALRSRFSGDGEFETALRQMGFGQGELSVELERQLGIQEMIDGAIAPEVSVSEEESRQFYADHPGYFIVPEQVRARHILIRCSPDDSEQQKASARARLEDIRRRVAAGEDFGELARELSEDGSGAEGGELGFFQRGEMVPAFSEAAFALKVGELSEPVLTEFGYHLIQVTEGRAESVLPYEEVAADLVEFLHHGKVMDRLEQLASELRVRAEVVEYDLGGALPGS